MRGDEKDKRGAEEGQRKRETGEAEIGRSRSREQMLARTWLEIRRRQAYTFGLGARLCKVVKPRPRLRDLQIVSSGLSLRRPIKWSADFLCKVKEEQERAQDTRQKFMGLYPVGAHREFGMPVL